MIVYPFLYFAIGAGLALASTALTRKLREKRVAGEYGYYTVFPKERRINWMISLFLFWPIVLGLVLPLMGLFFVMQAACTKAYDFLVYLEKVTR